MEVNTIAAFLGDQNLRTTDTPTFGALTLNGNLDMTSDLILNIGDAGTDFLAGGGLNLAGLLSANAGLTVASGQTTTLASFTTDGGLLYTNGSGVVAQTGAGSNGECLLSNGGGAPAWGSCVGSGGTNWNISQGAVSPKLASTLDLLLGSNATASSKFAFINVNSGTPTASISGNAGNNSLYITGSGTLATTNKQTLNIGSASTGDINIFGLGTGVVHSTNGILSSSVVTNAELANSSITVTSGTGLSVGGSPVSLGGTLTLFNTGVTSNIAGSGISVDQATGAVTITNTGVTSLAGTANQISVSGATGAVTLSLPQNIHSGASPSFSGLTLSSFTTNGGLLYTNGSGLLTQLTTQGSAGNCLLSGGAGVAPSFGACSSGGEVADAFWSQSNGALYSNNSTVDLLIGGQSTSSAKFAILNVNGTRGSQVASLSILS